MINSSNGLTKAGAAVIAQMPDPPPANDPGEEPQGDKQSEGAVAGPVQREQSDHDGGGAVPQIQLITLVQIVHQGDGKQPQLAPLTPVT